jgi:hypothetical protein
MTAAVRLVSESPHAIASLHVVPAKNRDAAIRLVLEPSKPRAMILTTGRCVLSLHAAGPPLTTLKVTVATDESAHEHVLFAGTFSKKGHFIRKWSGDLIEHLSRMRDSLEASTSYALVRDVASDAMLERTWFHEGAVGVERAFRYRSVRVY